MVSVTPQVGIDVAKDTLCVKFGEGRARNVANDEAGCKALCKDLPVGAAVHLESSGGYDRTVKRVLVKAGFEVRVLDPLKVRRLKQSKGVKAKTDPIDTEVLYAFGHQLPAQICTSQEQEDLRDHSRAIDTLKETAAGFRKRLGRQDLDDTAKGSYTRLAKAVDDEVRSLERKFAQRILSSSLGKSYLLVLGIPRVGPATARVAVCELTAPELFTPNQIASYAGLAPMANSSGKISKPPRLGRGNSHLKAAMYMPAVGALADADERVIYDRLRRSGRTHDAAIVPVMRKLLMRIVAVLKRGTPWTEELPMP